MPIKLFSALLGLLHDKLPIFVIWPVVVPLALRRSALILVGVDSRLFSTLLVFLTTTLPFEASHLLFAARILISSWVLVVDGMPLVVGRCSRHLLGDRSVSF